MGGGLRLLQARGRGQGSGDGAPLSRDRGGALIGLRRALRFRDVTLFFVVAVVSPRWIASAAAAGPGALWVWLVGAVALFVPLALTVIDLSARFPGEGGLYLWTGRAFGPFAGFMTAW